MVLGVGGLPIGGPGVGCEGLDPTVQELAAIDSVAKLYTWSGVTDELRDALYAAIGGPISLLREFARISLALWQLIVVHPAFSLPGIARLTAARRVARIKMGLTHVQRL